MWQLAKFLCVKKKALLLLAEEEMMLKGMIDRLIEINGEDIKVKRISRQPSPLQIMIDQKQLENVEYFSYFGSMITNDARCTYK